MEENNEKGVNYLDKIVEYIDLESLCELINILARLRESISAIITPNFTISQEKGVIIISNAKNSKVLNVRFYESNVEIGIKISDISCITLYSCILANRITENHLKKSSRRYITSPADVADSNLSYRAINYLDDDTCDFDEEIYKVKQLFQTGNIKSMLFSGDELQDITSYLDSSYHDGDKGQDSRGAFRKCNRKRLITS